MLKKFVYWHWKDDSQGQFSEGEDIPKFANGTPMFKESEVIKRYVIWAETWEEAMSIHYLRSGFGPYKPMGRPRECPDCHNYYYPMGSGKCFCGYDNNKSL